MEELKVDFIKKVNQKLDLIQVLIIETNLFINSNKFRMIKLVLEKILKINKKINQKKIHLAQHSIMIIKILLNPALIRALFLLPNKKECLIYKKKFRNKKTISK